MMRILFIDETRHVQCLTELPHEWHAGLLKKTELLWIDLLNEGEASEFVERLLTEKFGFHPLAIDDAINEIHLPKVDDWETFLYLALQDLVYDQERQLISLPELDIFLGRHFLVSYRTVAIPALERVWQSCLHNSRWLQHGADHLLYRLIDEMVNNYTAVLDQLESNIVQIESQIFTNPTTAVLESLTTFKRMTLQIRRVLAPQREVVNKLARDANPVIGVKDQVYFRDVYDHMVRLYNHSDSVRELLTGSTELYLSVVNNRMNDIMKTLTIITTFFMPLTFITGFFGMNFFQAVLPSQLWTGVGMLGITLFIMIALPVVMYRWVRRHAWM